MPMPTINLKAKQLIDAYIQKQPAFAKQILLQLRQIIHRADPNIVEDWKWGPNFNHDGMVANIAGFKEWVAIVFHNGAALKDSKNIFKAEDIDNLRSHKIKFRSLSEVNKIEKVLIEYLRQSVKNNESGIKVAKPQTRATTPMPNNIKKSLVQRGLAKAYAARPPYQQRDYVNWITAAKQAETQAKRLNKMLKELEDGNQYMGIKYKSK